MPCVKGKKVSFSSIIGSIRPNGNKPLTHTHTAGERERKKRLFSEGKRE